MQCTLLAKVVKTAVSILVHACILQVIGTKLSLYMFVSVVVAGNFSASAVVSELDWSADNADSEVWDSSNSIDCVVATGLNAIYITISSPAAYPIQPTCVLNPPVTSNFDLDV